MTSRLSEIELDADLQCQFEGRFFSVKASRGLIVFDAPDLSTYVDVIRNRPGFDHFREDLFRVNGLLNDLKSRVEIHVQGTCIATAGFRVHGSLESLLGFRQFKLRTLAMIRSFFRSL